MVPRLPSGDEKRVPERPARHSLAVSRRKTQPQGPTSNLLAKHRKEHILRCQPTKIAAGAFRAQGGCRFPPR